MDWETIITKCRKIKEEFDKSYICLNKDRPTSEETVNKHLQNLFIRLEEIRVLVNVNYERLNNHHKTAADAFLLDIKEKLITVAARKGIKIDLPASHHTKIEFPFSKELPHNTTMPQTAVEFLNTASRLIPDFDGKSENLRSFTDSLELVDSLKDTHETIAVSLIKTKLRGHARNLINKETTIAQIIGKLKNSVKGESVDVISAKIQNLKQHNKAANAYCNEIESLTKALEGAYISDGLSCELAAKYSTRVAVKAMSTNCNLDKVKLIMEAGKFDNMNEAISKFINTCSTATGQQNAILYYGQRPNNNSNRGNSRRSRGRGGNHRNQSNRGYGGNNNTDRQQGQNSYRSNRGGRNNNNVRTTYTDQDQSENSDAPLR